MQIHKVLKSHLIISSDSKNLVLLNTKTQELLDEELKTILAEFQITGTNRALYNGKLFFSGKEGILSIIDIENKSLEKKPLIFYLLKNKVHPPLILGFVYNESVKNLILYSVLENKTIFKFPSCCVDAEIYSNYIFYATKSKLTIINFETFETKAEIDIPLIGDMNDNHYSLRRGCILYVSDDTVWLKTENGVLLVKNWIHKPKFNFLKYSESGEPVYNVLFEKYNNLLLAINDNKVLFIDKITLEEEGSANFNSLFPDQKYSIKHIFGLKITGNYFTFLFQKDNHSGIIDHVGIFCLSERKLIWKKQVISLKEKNDGNRLTPNQQAHLVGNNIFIQDFKNNVHILEVSK